ncbi:MAG: peptidylprolyl isomerase [Flavobacteriaceae bacterium]|nr:peptidylprolyl isomerase [Flavobacteriaceae bacterium]
MNYIKIINILFLAILLTSCKDSVPKSTNTGTSAIKTTKDTTSRYNNVQAVKAKTPRTTLTQENHEDILLAFGSSMTQSKVVLHTTLGSLTIELFDETPLHRANFLYLTQSGYFDDTFFHRVVKDFIIQGGNSDLVSTARKRKQIGPRYRLASEVNPLRKHTYGTVSGAKEYRKNKEKMSAPYEFFIFIGPDISARHLNGEYTIFGQVIEGMDVVERIADLPTDSGEWPKTNVFIRAEIKD